MSSSFDLVDAKAAKRRSKRRENPSYEKVDAEPADPSYINHEARRSTRLHEPSYDGIPDPLLETVDGREMPMRMSDAREVWLGCKYREMNEDELTSPLDWLTDQYGHVLDAERQLMDEMENPSTMLLSLRQSPIREDADRRKWIEPLRLRSQLNKPWKNVRTTLNRHLSEYPRHEYVRLTGYTESAATPHYHILVYVEDKHNSLSLEVGEAAIGSYVRGNEYASMEHHPVNKNESDAAVIEHDIPRAHDRVDESNYRDVLAHRDGEPFKPSSEALLYLLTQRPEWCLAHIWRGSSDVHQSSNMVDASVVSWATSFADFTSSDGFQYSSYDGGG